MLKNSICLLLCLTLAVRSFSQEQRHADKNFTGWLVYTGQFKLREKITLHSEFQWRRVDGLKNGQQNLIRTGIMYAVRKDMSLNVGYAFADTYSYGDFPSAFSFPEHRFYEQVVIKNPVGNTAISHRFTLEQRIIGKVSVPDEEKNTVYSFLNRIRYRFRAEIPIRNSTFEKSNWSLALQDEFFIGFGKNTGSNVFDQNRIAALAGYQLNKYIKVEAGYINQVLQQSSRVNNKAVFQYNHGFTLAVNLFID